MHISRTKRLTLIVLFWQSASVSAASFDCQKAHSQVEQLICNDPALSAKDDMLNQSFQSAVKRSAAPQDVRRQQREWLNMVRNRCSSRSCLAQAYDSRISALDQQQAATATLAARCPVTEEQLLGPWEQLTSGGPFEEMNFSYDGATREFNSWLHHRPEFAGASWRLENCVIHVQHSTSSELQFELKVVRLKGNRLYLREDGTSADAVYRRIKP